MTDIEKEIQARVEYKMNEFLGNVQKTANYSWHHGIKTGEAKYINYWEALSMLRDFLNNELKRPLPSINLVEEFKTKHKGEVLDEIIKKLKKIKRGIAHKKKKKNIYPLQKHKYTIF